MANEKIKAPRISLIEFLNQHPLYKSKRVEILGGFAHWMENVKHVTQATENEFELRLAEFKNLPV
jgi:hypothetical protein